MPGRRPPIVGVFEVSRMLDVTPQRADQITRGPSFPSPFATLAAGRFWRTAAVELWAEERGRIVQDEWWDEEPPRGKGPGAKRRRR